MSGYIGTKAVLLSTTAAQVGGDATIGGDIIVSGTVDGRDVSVDGTKLDGIASGATAYTNSSVDAHLNTSTATAGEVLSWNGSDYNWLSAGSGTVTSVSATVPTGFSVSGSPITTSGTLGITYAAGYQGYTTAEASKLSGIEAGADVTDTANVTAAGALMDSELTNVAAVKNLDQGVATTNNPTFAGLTVNGISLFSNDITMTAGTPELKMYSPSSLKGYNLFSNVSDTVDGGLQVRDIAGKKLAMFESSNDFSLYDSTGTDVKFFWDASAQRLGVNNDAPTSTLDVTGDITATNATLATAGKLSFGDGDASIQGYSTGTFYYDTDNHIFRASATAGNGEYMRITSAGNVGIGVTSPSRLVSIGAAAYGIDYSSNLLSLTQDASSAGVISVGGIGTTKIVSDTNNNGTGNIIFETGAEERMSINSAGALWFAKTSGGLNVKGVQLNTEGSIYATTDGAIPLWINRLTSDGQLVAFRQDNVTEGSISVSGTTVSYNGGHLSRWSQMADGSRPDLLKGTVMSNLDQMSVWAGEDNEQLNCTEVSTVEGDPNVAGVFVAWDKTDDEYNDILLAMTGDMIIRIAQGTTVQRGDLLMSAGDGTAKPQDDDIVRSKTIAKVTSTHVTCTYEDGSYCVPCVLMTC